MRIQSVKLKDETTLEFGDFNVFIGGNMVGKTTFILELFHRAANLQRLRWHWIDGDIITYSSTNPDRDRDLMLSSMSRQYEGANIFYYSQAAKNLDGNIDLNGNLRFSQSEYQELRAIVEKPTKASVGLFNNFKYRRPFIAFASCEARLNLPNQVGITGLNQPPQDALNVLYRNRVLLHEIDKKVYEQFGLHLGFLDHSRTQLELGLSRKEAPRFNDTVSDLQQEFEKIDGWKQVNFTLMQDIGHGIRSIVKLLMSLLDPVNQVVLIDEPEMHIYPAQKRWLGHQMVQLARDQGKQVFIVTHDPIVLQGILDTPSTTRIFRIDLNDEQSRMIKRCDLTHIMDVGAKRNQDSYLQGLFYQRCIGVEGAMDRAFYQTIIEELFRSRIEDKDLGFVACGGKGASKNMVDITSKVGLRSAFIYDFDALLLDIPVIKDIFLMLGGQGHPLKKIEDLLRENFDGKRIKTETIDAQRLGLQSPFIQQHIEVFESAIKQLAEIGIFIVPGGTLESWVWDVEPKVRFAEFAPDRIKGDAKLRAPLEEFFKPILSFLGC